MTNPVLTLAELATELVRVDGLLSIGYSEQSWRATLLIHPDDQERKYVVAATGQTLTDTVNRLFEIYETEKR